MSMPGGDILSKSTQVKELTSKLEQGVKDLFQSDRYADYLRTMSRFHTYSTRNTLLIHMQKPGATHVAGFRAWPTKFKRHVKAGEKAIKILAPTPFVIREENEKLDPETRLPILGEDGLGLKKLPAIASLKQEYAALAAEKKHLYKGYHEAKDTVRQLLVAKGNAQRILGIDEQGRAHEERERTRQHNRHNSHER